MTTVAIDFGTSNTVVCVLDRLTQKPQTLVLEGISRHFVVGDRPVSVIPTQLFVAANGDILIGEVVRAQRLGLAQPERHFQGFKRDLVANFQPPPRHIDGQSYSATTVAERFLIDLWQQVQPKLQPSQVIFTVPVGAFEAYLDWFRHLAEQLDLPNFHLVDESTAAALGYTAKRPGALALVIDFGGGTLDLSLVRTVAWQSGQKILKAEVLAKADAYVGGVDIDIWIAEHHLRQMGQTRSSIGAIGWQNLLEVAEKLKIRLSQESFARESWFDDERLIACELSLTRSAYEELLEQHQFLEQLRQALDEVLAIALGKGIPKSQIDLVLLVGGSCLIPAVQQLILSYFGKQRVKLHKPFTAVAHGALSLSQLAGIDDYLHHSYAIRLWEPFSKTYSYYPLFDQGTAYPCQRQEPLTLQVAHTGQQVIHLDIGEVAEMRQAEVVYDSQGRMTSSALNQIEHFRSLSQDGQPVCVAHLDPPGEIGMDRISVTFQVNTDRALLATVYDLLTNQILVSAQAIAQLR